MMSAKLAKPSGKGDVTFMLNSGQAKRVEVSDTVAVGRPVTRQKMASKEKELLQRLANLAEQSKMRLAEDKVHNEVELSCLPPAFTREIEGATQYVKIVGSDADSSKMKLLVRNYSKSTKIVKRLRVLSKSTEFTLSRTITPEEEVILKAGCESGFELICNSVWQNVGTATVEVLLQYAWEDEKTNPATIIHFVKFEKKDALVKKLEPKKTRPKRPLPRARFRGPMIPGIRPPKLGTDSLPKKWKIPQYAIPSKVKDALRDGAFSGDAIVVGMGYRKMHELLESSLSEKNYAEKFHLLLYLEELRNAVDIRRYDMSSVKMTKQGRMMFLQVPGLAEKRPSVLRGDRIHVETEYEGGDENQKVYEGYVHHVELDRVALGFSKKLLSWHRGTTRYNVRFTYNRLPVRLAHRAVQSVLFERFPKKCSALYSDIKIRKREFKNQDICSNREQMQAVNSIVRGKKSSAPYIVFGPPGTGKTVTMVEAISQIIHLYEGCHVLVCAPSNSSCDLIAKLLLCNVPEKTIFRMHAASRPWKDVPSEIRSASNYRHGDYFYPEPRALAEYEIVVCTLVTAGRIASARFPDDHFSHVFIDEAGQATEPECTIALAGILAQGGQVVLAGDPKQLGPIVMSSTAKKFGLGISYLQRLMEMESLYEKDEDMNFNPDYITKLLINYRSHKAIMKIPNECFYDSELQFAVDETPMFSLLSQWDHLPRLGFPLVFEGVSGEDLQDSNSPSFYNPQEISVLVSYVQRMLHLGVESHNIGIITPYRKQVEKIKCELSNSHIKVGSVEEFQGQEREVIIVSTVRSDTNYLSFDAKHNLGFLSNPRRFNVAVTRAKALLVVIGNPRVLGVDYYWGRLLEYCVEKKAYRGIKYDPDERRTVDADDIKRIIENVALIEMADE